MRTAAAPTLAVAAVASTLASARQVSAVQRLVSGLTLTLLLATPARAGWVSHGPEGGVTPALAVDATTNRSTVYAGPSGGGVFKTTNGGGSWSAVNTGLTSLCVGQLAVDTTTSPSTVYAGTVGGGVFVYQIACGDGIVDGSEQCDDGTDTGTASSCCTAACQFAASGTVCARGTCNATGGCCGNGIVESGEQCDDGQANGTPGDCCTATCQFVIAGTSCTTGTCDGTAECTAGTTTTSTTTQPTTTTTTLPCTTARCTLGAALVSPACAGQTIPASVTGKFSRAESLIDQAATTPGKRARKVRQKARNLLKQAGTKATHAAKGKKAKLSAACAAVLKDAAGRVAAGL